MPRMKVVNGKKVRDYSQQRQYNATPEATKKRVENNQARHELAKQGKVHVGDGKDVDHIKPLSKGGAPTSLANLRAVPASTNRSFSRTSTSALKSQTSKRERRASGRKR